jgi:predicted nucleic acid-binding protein
MRTSVDTNILSALWSNESSVPAVLRMLTEAKRSGAVVICGVVYAELMAHPNATESLLNNFLEKTGISVDFSFDKAVWVEAGRRFAAYADRRRKANVPGAKRFLADFLVGAHALLQADRLLTLDTDRFRLDFPELRLLVEP